MIQIKLLTKQKETHRLRKFMVAGGKGELGLWEGHVHTAISKMDNKDLLCSTWDSAQC